MRARLPLALLLALVPLGCAERTAPLLTEPDAAAFAKKDKEKDRSKFRLASVSAGSRHVCGLTPKGEAYCWGANDLGQLGDGGTAPSPVPVPVSGGLSFAEIQTMEDFSCGLTRQGEVHCWGDNQFGQFGDGTRDGSSVPTLAAGGLRARALAVGSYHACALTDAGEAYCWGANASEGIGGDALGAPSAETCPSEYRGPLWRCSTTPVPVSGDLRFESISAGLWYTCGVTAEGAAHCWGWNLLGQLGDGTRTDRKVPTPVAAGRPFESLVAGAAHACALAADRTAHCWGGFGFEWGQLGAGTTAGSTTPVGVAGGHRFDSIAPSRGNNVYTFTCGTTSRGEAYCWGANRDLALGTDAPMDVCGSGETFGCSPVPLPVSGGLRLEAVSAGSGFACGVEKKGTAYCWGDNQEGQLGTGTMDSSPVPVPVAAP